MKCTCKICKESFILDFDYILNIIKRKQGMGMCPDCYLNLKWESEYKERAKGAYTCSYVSMNELREIDIFDAGLYKKLWQVIEINKKYLNTNCMEYTRKHPLFIRLISNDDTKTLRGFPVDIVNNYIIMREDLYSPGIEDGLHRIGELEFKVPIYRISKINVLHDYDEVYVKDISEPIIGYKAVPECNGILKTHNYIYEIGVAYEEPQRNRFCTDFQDCYSHFCRTMEDVLMCPGKTDYISSQINYNDENSAFLQIIRLFKIKAEKHCFQNTTKGWVTNKLTLLEEVKKEEIVKYFNEHPEAKEKVRGYYRQDNPNFEIWDSFEKSVVPSYTNIYTREEDIHSFFIKRCYNYNKPECKQNSLVDINICNSCKYNGLAGRFNTNSKALKYLLVKHRILNGTFNESDEEYLYLKEKNCKAELEAIERLLNQEIL